MEIVYPTTRVRQEGAIIFVREQNSNKFAAHYNGHTYEILETDYTNNPRDANLRIVEEDDTDSEASTAVVEFDKPFNPDEFRHLDLPISTDPPAYAEHVEHQQPTDTVQSEVSSVTLESQTPPVPAEEKEPAFPYLKARPGPSESKKSRKTKKNKGRNGKGRTPKKTKHKNKSAMASKSERITVETTPAPKMANNPSVRAASPAASATSTTSSGAPWSVVHKERFARPQRAVGAPAVVPSVPAAVPTTPAAAVNRGNAQRTWASVIVAAPAITSVVASPDVAAVDNAESTPSRSSSGAAETPRAGEPKPAQTEDGYGVTALDRARGDSVPARAAQRAEQEERRVWEADYARRQREGVLRADQGRHSARYPRGSQPMSGSSSSHPTRPSEVTPSWMSMGPASVSRQNRRSGHLEGGNQTMVRSSVFASWCGFFRSCCAHVPYWFQENPAGLILPSGCCCNHAQHRCCLCLPPGRWWRIPDGAFFVLPDSAIGAIPEGPEEEASVNEVSQSGQSHAQTQSTVCPAPVFSPSSSPTSPSLGSTRSLPLSQLALDRLVVTMPLSLPTSPVLSAVANTSSVAFTVKGDSAKACGQQEISVSSPVAVRTATRRVIPVIPLRLHRPVISERAFSDTTSTEGKAQRELVPAVASIFGQARQSRAGSVPSVQVDSAPSHSRDDSHDATQVNDTAEESNMAHADEFQRLDVNKHRLAAPSIEQDLRSPSLYFDAKQQLSSPALSSSSREASPKKSCMKSTSVPTPRGDSPPRSVQFSDDKPPVNSPTANEGGTGASPSLLRSRVSSRHNGVQSEENTDTMNYVQSLWHDEDFKDLSIVLQPNPCMVNSPQFLHVAPETFKVHKSIVSASPFLRRVIEFLYARDGEASIIHVHAGPEFNYAIAFRKALVTLYGKKMLTHERLRHVTLKSMGFPDDDGHRIYPWSINAMQVRFALCYAIAGAFLARREIVKRGIELALGKLTWETCEFMLYFTMTMRDWMLTCPDIVLMPTGSPHHDPSKAHEVGRIAFHDFHFNWVEQVKHAVLNFCASNTWPSFKLYDRGQANHYPTRIPKKLWTLPNSFLSNPALEHVRFGSRPSIADQRPSRYDEIVVSGLLLTLPFALFMDFLDIVKNHNKMTVALLKEVVDQREERRLHALRIYHRNTWEPGAIAQDEFTELCYREFVSGELNPTHDDGIAIATTSVQRIWVGIEVPDMGVLASRPLRQSDLAFSGTSAPGSQVLTPTTTSQGLPTHDATEEGDRGRDRERKKKKKKKTRRARKSPPRLSSLNPDPRRRSARCTA